MAETFFEKPSFIVILIALIVINLVFLGLISSYAVSNRAGLSCTAETYNNYEEGGFEPSYILNDNLSFIVESIVTDENKIIYNTYSEFCFQANNSAPVYMNVFDEDLKVVGKNIFPSGYDKYCTLINKTSEKTMTLGLNCLNCNGTVNSTLYEALNGDPTIKIFNGTIVSGSPLIFDIEQRSNCGEYLSKLTNRFLLFNGAFLFLALLIYAINSFTRWIFDW